MKLPLIPAEARKFAYVSIFNFILFLLGRKSVIPVVTSNAEISIRRIFTTTCSIILLVGIGVYQGAVQSMGYELAFQLLTAFTTVRAVRAIINLSMARTTISTTLYYAIGTATLALFLGINDLYLNHPVDVPILGKLMAFLKTSNYEVIGWRTLYLVSLIISLTAMYIVFKRERTYFTQQRRTSAIDVLPVLELALICVIVFNKINN